jgi:hypothetical protein
MSATLQRHEQGHRPVEQTPGAGGPAPDLRKAKAFLITGLAWACLVVLSWLGWRLAGDAGREAIASAAGLSAARLTPYVLAALVAEKLAAKALLFASLYHWLKGR